MIHVYINYPNPHITIHGQPSCSAIQQQHKQDQRVVDLNRSTLSAELERFAQKHYRFGADAESNDMWLRVEFDGAQFEAHVVEYVRVLLARHYIPFGRIQVEEHCS